MASVKFLTLLAVLCACSGFGHGDPVTTEKPVTIDLHAPPTNILETVVKVPKHLAGEMPEPAPSTDAPTTSPDPTTTSAPNTTTTSTTTPSTTTSSTTTTVAPTPTPAPTPAPAPAPKPAPGPLPHPDQGMWWYADKETNITCVMVQFAAQLNISYTQVNNTNQTNALFNIPANATVTNGSCNETKQWIELSWPAGVNATNTLTLVFVANATTKTYEMQSVNVTISADMLENATVTGDIQLWHERVWETPLATSYRCDPPSAIKLTGGDNSVYAGAVTVARLQEEAFRKSSEKGFSAARECGGGDVPDAVPIAVGCALGGLVLVVLAAYLVARRRSAARGYLSM